MLRQSDLVSRARFVALFACVLVTGCASTVVPAFGDAPSTGIDATDMVDAVDRPDAPDVHVVEFAMCDGGRCADDERLNRWTGLCQSRAIEYPGPGRDIGDPCTTEAVCRSAGHRCPIETCIWHSGNGVQGGYCLSPCTLTATPFGGDRFPQSDCPNGALCLPHPDCLSGSDGTGDCVRLGACVRECATDADCRVDDGFYCRRVHYDPAIGAQRTYQNGYCAPAHCSSRGCPNHLGCGC